MAMRLHAVCVALSAFGVVFAGGWAKAPPSGDLSFREVSIPVGKSPRFIAAADLNHDGKVDLVVANEESESLTVLLGDGKGHFQQAKGSPVSAGHLPNDIAVADMNHDGNADLVIANHQSPYIGILLGDGKGGFQPAAGSPFDVHSNPHPHGVAVGAFSGSSNMDVVTDSWGNNQIELLRGDGKGGLLLPGRFFRVGRRPYERLRSADFNKDGLPDVVTTNLDDDTVTILLSDGKGGFREASGSPGPAGGKPWQLAIDDFNKDGNPDLAIIPYERDLPAGQRAGVTVLLGDGKGSFTPMPATALSLEGCHGPSSIATGDINGDGRPDIVVLCAESKNLAIFLSNAEKGFTLSMHATPGGWGSVTVVDLDADGKADIITANNDDGTITIYFSN
jgi:FG-GAP-like repeat